MNASGIDITGRAASEYRCVKCTNKAAEHGEAALDHHIPAFASLDADL